MSNLDTVATAAAAVGEEEDAVDTVREVQVKMVKNKMKRKRSKYHLLWYMNRSSTVVDAQKSRTRH